MFGNTSKRLGSYFMIKKGNITKNKFKNSLRYSIDKKGKTFILPIMFSGPTGSTKGLILWLKIK
jgi:hypothetical protein